ncbi:MAG TPA: hypothetical protein ENK52_01395 [Saprospiraceae bacterium]|nr:hypothetical protein [Saprospiraceae bacterium]
MNPEELYNKICTYSEKYGNRDLQEYLLGLYSEVLKNKNKPFTFLLLNELLSNAFSAKPLKFQKEWLNCNTAPDENILNKKFTNPEFSNSVDKSNTSELPAFEFTIAVLQFQIAELEKMKGKQLENQYRYFGIDSETGNRWYNFDPFGNLECGARCLLDNDMDLSELDWSFLGELLEAGRIYE